MNGGDQCEYWYVNWYNDNITDKFIFHSSSSVKFCFEVISPRNFYRNIQEHGWSSWVETLRLINYSKYILLLKLYSSLIYTFKPSRYSNLSSLDKMVLAQIIIIKFPNRNYLVSLVSIEQNLHESTLRRSRRCTPLRLQRLRIRFLFPTITLTFPLSNALPWQ